MHRSFSIILFYDQRMHDYFTNFHTPTCFDTIVSSSGSFQSIPRQVTQVFQIPCQHDNSIYIQTVYTATTQNDFMGTVAT